jgi:hypothetical protein
MSDIVTFLYYRLKWHQHLSRQKDGWVMTDGKGNTYEYFGPNHSDFFNKYGIVDKTK